MDGEKAAEAFFRCIVSMSNLEVAILLSGHLSPAGSILAVLDSWNDVLKDWPRLPLTEQNLLWYSADNSFSTWAILHLLYGVQQDVVCG